MEKTRVTIAYATEEGIHNSPSVVNNVHSILPSPQHHEVNLAAVAWYVSCHIV